MTPVARSPELKKAMAHLSRAKARLLDALCVVGGFDETQPFLRKTYRQALRDQWNDPNKPSPERDFIAVFLKVRKEASVVGLTDELDKRLMNALLDLYNTKPQALRYREPR